MSNSRSDMFKVYKKVEKAGDLQKSPYEIVKLVLNELSRSMEILSDDINRKKNALLIKEKQDIYSLQQSISKTVTRSLTTIYSLQTSLDFEKGGEIANSLFHLYEYCRIQIIQGFTRCFNEGIIKARHALDQIIIAWSNISLEGDSK
jgi:flagellar protein FliS